MKLDLHCEPAEKKARELCEKENKLLGKYSIITRHISNTVVYDYLRALEISRVRGFHTDIMRCFEKRMGICTDISGLTVCMLRAVGIKAKLVIGRADNKDHAWVEAVIDHVKYRYDHDGKASVYKRTHTF